MEEKKYNYLLNHQFKIINKIQDVESKPNLLNGRKKIQLFILERLIGVKLMTISNRKKMTYLIKSSLKGWLETQF